MTNQDRLIVNGPPASPVAIILTHGAGAGMDTDFMNTFAEGLAGHGFRVVRFEFPYMAERRQTGKRRPPDREPVLRQTWLDVIASIEAETLIIGGKSLGGRIASLIADEAEAAGLVCLGYTCPGCKDVGALAPNNIVALGDVDTKCQSNCQQIAAGRRFFPHRDSVRPLKSPRINALPTPYHGVCVTLNQRVVGSSPTGGTLYNSRRTLALAYLPASGSAA